MNLLRDGARCAALIGLAFHVLVALAGPPALPEAQDLRAEAKQAADRGGPLIILFSRRDCKYCETVRRDYLQPLLQDARYRDRIVVREVSQDRDAALTGFRGEASTHAGFARSEKVRFVPVVAFYGPDGKPLAEPILGARLPDFYPGYLEDAISQSQRNLAGR